MHGDLGKPGVSDDPDRRSAGIRGISAAVDGPFGEQRAALIDDVRALRHDHYQLAAEGVDLERDLAAGEHRVGQVDDQRAEARGQPGKTRYISLLRPEIPGRTAQ